MVAPETKPLEFIDHCNPPSPFAFPEVANFEKLPALIDEGIEVLTAHGFSDLDARLKIGRLLWHWRHDGNPLIEEAAFALLDGAYESQQQVFFRHELREHRQHRHRANLDVFD